MTARSWIRNLFAPTPRLRRQAAARCRPALEVLEDRLVPASTPAWTDVGPAPEVNGGTAGIGDLLNPTNPANPANPVSGAVQVLRLVPNSTIAYAGTVNGGVWDTLDYTAKVPKWVALTDGQASLSIRDIAISQVDPSGLTIYAATGNSSNLRNFGGGGTGIYKITIDPGTGKVVGAITTLGQNPFINKGLQIGSLLVTGTALVNGQLQDQLLASTLNGGALYTSTNGGQSWTEKTSGATGLKATDLVQVPQGAANAVQMVTLSGPASGTYNLTFQNQTTPNLALGTTAANLQAALQHLSSIGAGNVVVASAGVPNAYTITFQGALAGQNLPRLTASATPSSSATVTTVTPLFAAVAGTPWVVLKSMNDGATWEYTTLNYSTHSVGTTDNIRLAVSGTFSPGAVNYVLYAAVDKGGNFQELYRSATAGTTWTALTALPGTRGNAALTDPTGSAGQGDLNLALVADPTNKNIVYIAGTTAQPPPTSVASTFPVTFSGSSVVGRSQTTLVANDANLTGTTPVVIVSPTTEGGSGTNAIQTIGFGGVITGGTFTLSYTKGASTTTSDPIPWSPDPATLTANIQAAMDKIVGAHQTSVTTTFNAGYLANIWRGTFSGTQTPNTQWVSLVTAASSPHADSRNMILSRGSLYEVDDGGIYQLANPTAVNPSKVASQHVDPVWSSLVGNMQDAELVSAAYDSFNGGYLAGAQDNGSPVQILSNGTLGFVDKTTGDGSIVAVDPTEHPTTLDTSTGNGTFSFVSFDTSYRYFSADHLTNFQKAEFDSTGSEIASYSVNFTVNGATVNGVTNDFFDFYQVFALSQTNPNLMLVGSKDGTIYQANLSTGQLVGGQLTVPLQAQPVTGLPTAAIPVQSPHPNGTITALAFGDVSYVGTTIPHGTLLIRAPGQQLNAGLTGTSGAGSAVYQSYTSGQNSLKVAVSGLTPGTTYTVDVATSSIGSAFAGLVGSFTTDANGTGTLSLTSLSLPIPIAAGAAIFIQNSRGSTVLTGNFTAGTTSFAKATGYQGGAPVAITVDSRDANRAYILDAQGRVWVTLNGGSMTPTFTQIGGASATVAANLPALPATTTLRWGAITIIPNSMTASSGETVLVSNPPGTTGGGVYMAQVPAGAAANPPDFTKTKWQPWGNATQTTNPGLLPDVQVTSLQYYQQANLVVAATIGRGIWVVTNATSYLGLQASPSARANGQRAAAGSIPQPPNRPIGAAPLPAALQVTAANNTLTEAVVTLFNRRDGTAEFLSADVAGTNISAAYDASTGTLTLTGTDTAADYQQVLQSIDFHDLAPDPSPVPRQVTLQVSDGVTWSDTTTIALDIIPNNPDPGIDLDGTDGGDTNVSFTEGQGPVALAPALTLADPESATLDLATVRILNLQDVGNEFLTADTTGTSISATYNAQTGVLSLFGSDSLADYQKVLRTVAYNNLANAPGPLDRGVAFTLNDGISTSPTAEVEVSVQAVNIAPVLTNAGPFALPAAGMTVASLLAGPNGIPIAQDLSGNAISGIAVIGVDNSKGVWQYRTDPDQPWHNMGNPTDGQAVLLFNDPDTSIRFVPTVPGTVTASLLFRVWDGTGETLALAGLSGGDPDAQGGNGTPQPISDAAVVNTLGGGGSSPFSAGVGVLQAGAAGPSTASQGVFGFFRR